MTLTKKQKKVLKLIRDRERRFKRMSKARKRVAIARDVIEQIRIRKIVPEEKTWVNVCEWKNGRPEGEDLRQALIKAKECSACALGAIFVCSVFRDPGERVSGISNTYYYEHEVGGADDIHNKLRKYFTNKQLRMIELAFEEGNGWAFTEDSRDEDAVRFGMQFSSPAHRMEAIMNNIIDNNGTFNPPKFPS